MRLSRLLSTSYYPVHGERTIMICSARIQECQVLTQDIIRLNILPENEQFSWLAGQWIDFSVRIDEQEHVAGYSICSAAGRGPFELLVRKSRHPVSLWLHSADRSNTTVLIQGGSGECVYHPEKHEAIVCIAGGIGITPIISMLRTAQQAEKPATLYHSVKHRNELIFAHEFPDAHYVVTSESQRLDFPHIARQYGKSTHYFLCGPQSFIDEAAHQLPLHGAHNIHFERWW